MKKRMIALLIVLALMLSVMPTVFAAEAASGTCGKGVKWALDKNGTLTISGKGEIDSLSFESNAKIVNLIIGEGITAIQGGAFMNCANLKSISLPESLVYLNMSVFANCTSLESVEIPANVGFLPEGVFGGCTSLKTITLHEGLRGFGRGALSGCASLESITLPSTVTDIHTMAFASCTSLKSIYIPASVEAIDLFAFEGCSSLTGIWVDKSNAKYFNDERGVLFERIRDEVWLMVAPGALSGSYAIPEGVSFAFQNSFAGCANLKEVTIPDSLDEINHSMFKNCTSLESISISASVESINDYAFSGCTSLKNLFFEGNAPEISEDTPENEGYDSNNASFAGVTATCYYPVGNDTWTEDILKDYGGDLTWICGFSDVAPGEWYESSVKWAVEKGITTGIGNNKFNPNGLCTRAQIVTFLWRAAGEPVVEDAENPFVDVAEDAYYYNAVLWAVENGITSGMNATHFNPDAACTRAQVVTFLWRAQKQPAQASKDNPFTDVVNSDYTAWYYDAVLWAVENGITNGMTETTFAPDATCTRAQSVTFLYRSEN